MPFEKILNDVIVKELGELKDYEAGSEDFKVSIDGVTKLIDRATEIHKLETSTETQREARDLEKDLKEQQFELDRDRLEFEREKLEFERERLKADVEARKAAQYEEYQLKREALKDDRIDKIARNVLTGFTFGGTMFTIWCLASATFTFEEKGTITSALGRKVLGMLVPKL